MMTFKMNDPNPSTINVLVLLCPAIIILATFTIPMTAAAPGMNDRRIYRKSKSLYFG